MTYESKKALGRLRSSAAKAEGDAAQVMQDAIKAIEDTDAILQNTYNMFLEERKALWEMQEQINYLRNELADYKLVVELAADKYGQEKLVELYKACGV